jgi:glucose-6-phosphate-specific signal transduction histidine kinase
VDAGRDEAVHETLERLRREVADLRARSRRLVLAADADRRAIERALHERVQQQLVALAVDVQLVRQTTGADPASAKALLDELARYIDEALDET